MLTKMLVALVPARWLTGKCVDPLAQIWHLQGANLTMLFLMSAWNLQNCRLWSRQFVISAAAVKENLTPLALYFSSNP